MASYKINLHKAVYSLSDALDLVGVTHIHHGKRVAYMAAEFGKHMGWEHAQLDKLFQSAILHDCGVSKTTVHAKLAQLQWEEEGDHCKRGASLLSSSPLLAHLAPTVKHHHTHWPELDRVVLAQEAKFNANCIYLADRVDVLTLKYGADGSDILLWRDDIRTAVKERRGEWFCPELVDSFLDVSASEAFWFSLENEHLNGYVGTWLAQTDTQDMVFEELRSLVQIFSRIVDAKSHFTREHSDGVAQLARYLGAQFGLPDDTCELLELAGLLHDIGKLRVPDELLEKAGELNRIEKSLMDRHSFDSYNILKNIQGLEQVALWAGQHHERMDGTGYPYRKKNDGIPLEARIIAVADIFQALAQRRPYRDALPPERIMQVLKQQVESCKLDGEVVAMAEAHLPECMEAALRSSRTELV